MNLHLELFPKRNTSLILARVNFECCDSVMCSFMLGDSTNSNPIQTIRTIPATFSPQCSISVSGNVARGK